MDIDTRINGEYKIRITTITGKISFDDLVAALSKIYSNPEQSKLPNSVWDLRQADVSSFTNNQIQNLVSFVTSQWELKPNLRSAIVVGSDLNYGLSNIYQKILEYSSPIYVRVFKDYDKALAWLKSE